MRTFFAFLFVALCGCKSNNKITQVQSINKPDFTPQYVPGPQALIYKTKGNYNDLVPVLLSEDKKEIIAYPHPNDIKTGEKFQYPTMLNNGYLLDNRGIGNNVAFLRLTYKEYSELKSLPSLEELYSYIIDKDPLIELCNCGSKKAFTDIDKQLNSLIDTKNLRTTCKTIK